MPVLPLERSDVVPVAAERHGGDIAERAGAADDQVLEGGGRGQVRGGAHDHILVEVVIEPAGASKATDARAARRSATVKPRLASLVWSMSMRKTLSRSP